MVTSAAPSSAPADVLDEAAFDRAIDLLVARDDDLAAIIARHGRPTLWSRPATFATLVLLILEQQVSLASGKAAFDRLRAAAGEVTPTTVAALGAHAIHGAGTTRQKAGYVHGLASGILDGTVDWHACRHGNRDDARAALLSIRGIGPWTADVWLLACRRLRDEWPIGDRALQVGVGDVLGTAPLVGDDLVAAAEPWRPHRSTAARLVWHAYLSQRDRAELVVQGLDPA